MKTYLRHSFIDKRLITGPSSIDGIGIFTKGPIKRGEVIIEWGGIVISRNNFDISKFRPMSIVTINDEYYLALPITDEISLDEFLNHSCNSNTWMEAETKISARHDIRKGEEVTLDCWMWDSDQDWPYLQKEFCSCGSNLCRKKISINDWKNPELQQRYKGHFSPYIQEKIKLMET